MTTILHLIGPGGAGKTTVGPYLARRLGWQFVDLDERFMSREGSIDAAPDDVASQIERSRSRFLSG